MPAPLRYYSKKEARELAAALAPLAPIYGGELEPVAELDAGRGQVIVACRGGRLLVGRPTEGLYAPALTDSRAVEALSYVVVDQGAVRHIVNGANVMRPGIIEHSDFSRGDVVSVREPNYRKAVAVGSALVPSADLASMDRGPVVRNVHYLRDAAWELLNDAEVRGMLERASR